MNRNLKIARRLIRIARILLAFNEHISEKDIKFIHDEFKKDLENPNSAEYKRWRAKKNEKDSQAVMDEKSIEKCLDAFDEMMKEVIEHHSIQSQYISNLVDIYREKYGKENKDDAVLSSNLLDKIFHEIGIYLQLKDFK